MTERSAEQAPVRARPDAQDTAADPRWPSGCSAGSAPPPRSAGPPPGSRASAPPAELPPPRGRTEEPGPAPNSADRDDPSTADQPAYAGQPRRCAAPRRARLRLSRIDPWSVMKVSFLLSIAFGIVTVVSVFMVWSVLGAAGVWDSINNTVSDTSRAATTPRRSTSQDYLGMSRVLGFTMLVSVIDVVLITAIATLGGVPLQHGGVAARRHRGHPGRGPALTPAGRPPDAVLGAARPLR